MSRCWRSSLRPKGSRSHPHEQKCFQHRTYHVFAGLGDRFGRDSIGMPNASKIKVKSVSDRFIFGGCTAREVSNNANDPSPAAAAKRAQLAPYLERFMGESLCPCLKIVAD